MHSSVHTLIFFVIVAGVLVVAAIPLILRKVPRNPWYGLRIPRTMHGTEAEWYDLNRKGGLVLLAIGLLLVPAAVAFGLIQH